MSAGEEGVRKDGVGSGLPVDESETLKLSSSEENLPKGDDSRPQVVPKSEAIGETGHLKKEKSEGKDEEVAKVSEEKQTVDDKSPLIDVSEKSQKSSEEKLSKEDDSESQVAPKVKSEAIGKNEDLENEKSGGKKDEVAKGCSSVGSEMKDLRFADDEKSPSKSEEKQTEDKSSLTAGSESSLQSSEEKSESYESARNSLQSSEENSGSYKSASKSSLDGYVKMGLLKNPTTVTQSLEDGSTGESETPSEEGGKKDASVSIPTGENKPSADESIKSSGVKSTEIQSDVSADKPVSQDEGKIEEAGDRKPLSTSPDTAEDDGTGPSQKRKAVQSGTPKRFLGMSFGTKSADKSRTPKKSSASDTAKSPKKSDVPDKPSDKPETPKKSDSNEPSEKVKSPRKFSLLKMSKGSKKSDGPDELADKVKSPEKCNKINEPLKKSKKSDGSDKFRSPKKSIGSDKVKSPKKISGPELLEKPKGSKKCGELEESTTDSPVRQSQSRSFLHGVRGIIQRLSPGDPKEPRRPVCSSSCNPDFSIKSPELSPIGHVHHFSASYLGSHTVHTDSDADRIDYSKLAEDRIITTFLSSHECSGIMPVSGKVIILSVDLLVKNAFSALVTNEINAAPLWDSGLHDFVGFLTITDFINVLRHYFYSTPEDIKDIENQSISTWRRITEVPNRFVKVDSLKSLSEATKLLVQEGVHRVPVFEEKRQCVLFVLTRKGLLQYLSVNLFDKLEQLNVKPPSFFKRSLKEIRLGTYENIATVTESTKVIDALDLFVNRGVSSLPVVDEKGVLKDIFGKLDVFALAKEQMYHDLEITVYEVVRKGVPRECAVICTLDESLGAVIQRFISTKSHRIVVINEYRSVVGIVSLSDLLKFLVVEPLAAIALEAEASAASDIIEEGVEGAVGGAEGDSVFNDDSENVSGQSGKEDSLALSSMKDLTICEDNGEEPVAEDVSKSE